MNQKKMLSLLQLAKLAGVTANTAMKYAHRGLLGGVPTVMKYPPEAVAKLKRLCKETRKFTPKPKGCAQED